MALILNGLRKLLRAKVSARQHRKEQYWLKHLKGSRRKVGEITYSAGVSGQVNILSTYTGDTNSEFVLTFTSSGGFDLVKDSVYVDSYDFTANTPLALDNISISMTGRTCR